MTPDGLEKLKIELKRLKSVERPKVIEAIAVARDHGDLSENAEYDAAKEKQAFIESRVRDIEYKIVNAQVVDQSMISTEKVVFGVMVTLLDLESDEEIKYQIVGADEADVSAFRISVSSPVARSLIGKKIGDTVQVVIPRGTRELEILDISLP